MLRKILKVRYLDYMTDKFSQPVLKLFGRINVKHICKPLKATKRSDNLMRFRSERIIKIMKSLNL